MIKIPDEARRLLDCYIRTFKKKIDWENWQKKSNIPGRNNSIYIKYYTDIYEDLKALRDDLDVQESEVFKGDDVIKNFIDKLEQYDFLITELDYYQFFSRLQIVSHDLSDIFIHGSITLIVEDQYLIERFIRNPQFTLLLYNEELVGFNREIRLVSSEKDIPKNAKKIENINLKVWEAYYELVDPVEKINCIEKERLQGSVFYDDYLRKWHGMEPVEVYYIIVKVE